MIEWPLLVQCSAEGCSIEFPPGNKGKRFCSDSCRARAHEQARFKAKLAHRMPEQTPERRALRMAGLWLKERIA